MNANANAHVKRLPADNVVLAGTGFHVEVLIGGGGMGRIYEASCRASGERVAVKLLRPEYVLQREMIDRMRVEGEVLASVCHPHVVGWRGHGITAAGTPYVAMERVHGRSLHHELRRRAGARLAFPEAVCHVRQLLSALSVVHAAGIVHRDIKPGNILVDRSARGRTRVKLLDFGVAKVLAGSASVRPLTVPTQEGACVGTPRYVAPEQILGGEVDGRADLYAAGILLYRLIAGRGPFDHLRSLGLLMRAHLEVAPLAPSRFMDATIPAALDAAILRALAKRPDERFPDAASFERELARVGHRQLPRPRTRSHARVETNPAPQCRAADALPGARGNDTPPHPGLAPAYCGHERCGHERCGHQRCGHERRVTEHGGSCAGALQGRSVMCHSRDGWSHERQRRRDAERTTTPRPRPGAGVPSTATSTSTSRWRSCDSRDRTLHARTTVVRPRFDVLSTVLVTAPQPDVCTRSRAGIDERSSYPPSRGAGRRAKSQSTAVRPGCRHTPISGTGVALSAAAFAAMASGVALWFVG